MALPALAGTNDPMEVAHADSGSEEDLGGWGGPTLHFGCIPESPRFRVGEKQILFCSRFSFFC